jgi:hypothetical protein
MAVLCLERVDLRLLHIEGRMGSLHSLLLVISTLPTKEARRLKYMHFSVT